MEYNTEFIEATPSSLYRCTVCRTNKNTPLPPFKKSKLNQHIESKSHVSRAAHERVRLLELKPAKGLEQARDIPVFLPLPVPEPLAHIDPPQHYFNVDETSIPSDSLFTAPPPPAPPPPDIDPHIPGIGEYSYAYEDPILSDSAWAVFEHEHHDYTLDSDVFSTYLSAEFFNDVQSAEEAFAGGVPRTNAAYTGDPGFWPYINRAHYLTHVLFNAPHVRFSVAQQQAILDWAIEMGMTDVPSLYALLCVMHSCEIPP